MKSSCARASVVRCEHHVQLISCTMTRKVQKWNVLELDMRSLDDSKVRKGWFVDFCWLRVAVCG